MTLISFSFMLFCFVTIFIYFVVPKKLQWVVLFLSSLIFLFYKNLNIGTILQAFIVLVTSYFCGILMDKYRDTVKSKRFLILGIVIILGLLVYLKYTNLLLVTFNHIFGLFNVSYRFGFVSRNSLIGISYYSLIMISYLVDIYRGSSKVQRNIFKLLLFLSYFPILTSGPFVRYKDMESNLYGGHKFNYDALCKGLLRACFGAFKILVISERLGYFVNTVYGDVNAFQGFYVILAMLFFALQLYTNFSGSIDIIMGISEIMGISLPENFILPFFSQSITVFWRNWHITLGAWLKDYIFYPLLKSDLMQSLNKKCKKKFGKKVGKKIPLYLSMLLMWILIGAWHGGEYKYIISSGILQFVFMFFEDLLAPISNKFNNRLGINTDTFSYKLYQVIRTYVLFSFSMIFFRANSISHAVSIIRNMFVWNPWILFDNSSLYNAGLDILDFRVLIISVVVLLIVELLSRNGNVRDKLFSQNIVFRWSVVFLLVFSVIIFGCYGEGYDPTAFIYRNF